MKRPLRILALLLAFTFCSTSVANTPFSIPRSTVVELKDPVSGRTYPLFIKLPKSYNTKREKKYPVIYLTDAWYSFQIVSGATRFPMNSGAMEEAIIVGISYSKGSKGASSRIRDFTPVEDKRWKFNTGEAKKHTQFIHDIVIHHIDNNYRTDMSKKTFVGNSLGGLLGAYILFNQPNIFNHYILGSPSVWFKDNYILSSSVHKSKSQIKVYLSVGNLEKPEFGSKYDMVADAEALAKKIKEQSGSSIDLNFSVVENAKHATAFPTTAIQGLDWIYSISK